MSPLLAEGAYGTCSAKPHRRVFLNGDGHLALTRDRGLQIIGQPADGGRTRPKSKREKLLEIGEQRANAAVKAIRYLQPLGNRQMYDLREEDVQTIVGALRKEIDELAYALANPGKPAQTIRLRREDGEDE